jgi:hypothetical protein
MRWLGLAFLCLVLMGVAPAGVKPFPGVLVLVLVLCGLWSLIRDGGRDE